jgi:hypothetical protein
VGNQFIKMAAAIMLTVEFVVAMKGADDAGHQYPVALERLPIRFLRSSFIAAISLNL